MMDKSNGEIWNKKQRQYSLFERLFQAFNNDHNNNNTSNNFGSLTIKNKSKSFECVTLPLTEVTVNLIEKTVFPNEKRLGKLDVNYASFILHQACLSPTSIILAMIYLDRVKKFDSECLDKMSSSELFLASLIVASKFLFDKGGDELVYNDEWASFANLDLNDLNKLERDFLEALKWSCFVDPETFNEQVIKFEGLISINEYLKRNENSMTYLEMIAFFKYLKYFHKDNQFVWTNITEMIQSILICAVAYFIAIGIVMISSALVFTVQNHLLNESTGTLDTNLTTNLKVIFMPLRGPLSAKTIQPADNAKVSFGSNDFHVSLSYDKILNTPNITTTTLEEVQQHNHNNKNNDRSLCCQH